MYVRTSIFELQVPIIFTKAAGGSSAREQFRKDILAFSKFVDDAFERAWTALGWEGVPCAADKAKYYLEAVPGLQSVDRKKYREGKAQVGARHSLAAMALAKPTSMLRLLCRFLSE